MTSKGMCNVGMAIHSETKAALLKLIQKRSEEESRKISLSDAIFEGLILWGAKEELKGEFRKRIG